MKPFICTLVLCNLLCMLYAQVIPATINAEDTLQEPKQSIFSAGNKWLAGGAATAGMAGTILFNYKSMNYEHEQKFHKRNDILVWKQVDKTQHAFLAYNVSRWAAGLWRWSGMPNKKAAIVSSVSTVAYLTAKEYLDGHNTNGGWSWGDIGANTSGVILFAAQELGWKEQKLNLKMSSKVRTYEPSLQERTDKLFGTNTVKRLLKDYNAQTYWLSGNIQSLFHLENFPKWINISIGFGADDMYGNYANIVYDRDDGTTSFDRSDIKRYRQMYIAPDIDLTRIRTNKKVLKTVFLVLNSLKIPAPALEISRGKLKGHVLYF